MHSLCDKTVFRICVLNSLFYSDLAIVYLFYVGMQHLYKNLTLETDDEYQFPENTNIKLIKNTVFPGL